MLIQIAAEAARERLKAAAAQRKGRADQRAQEEVLPVGQLVYLRDHSNRGRNKIQDSWAPAIHQVIKAPKPGGCVYTVAPQQDLLQTRQVNRAMLKPVPAGQRAVQPTVSQGPHARREEEVEDDDELYIMVGPGPVGAPVSDALPVGPVVVLSPPTAPVHQPVPSPPTASVGPPAPPSEAGTIRRSTRETAGQHSNPHNLPVAMGGGATLSRVPSASSSTSVVFRPWC